MACQVGVGGIEWGMSCCFDIDAERWMAAVVELNSMSPCDGVVMTRAGEVKVGYVADDETLCLLLAAPKLARMLTAAGLSSYSDKELRKWIGEMDVAPFQAAAYDAARAAGLLGSAASV